MKSMQTTETPWNTTTTCEFEHTPVTNHMLPSERFGKRIWMWLVISFPVLWIVHCILLGIGFVLGEHFHLPTYLIAFIYAWLCIQSTSDVYNSISTIVHNRNTLLGYLYAIGLSLANVGFWLLAMETTFAPFVMLLMIGVGLCTGRLTEMNMRKSVYSEKSQRYLKQSRERSFPIECLPTVLQAVDNGNFSHLKTLPARYDENCCTVQMRYSRSTSEAMLNVETEVEIDFTFVGFTFTLPMTRKTVVYSRIVQSENSGTPHTPPQDLHIIQEYA